MGRVVTLYLGDEELAEIERQYKELKQRDPRLTRNHFIRNIVRRGLGLEPLEKPYEKMVQEVLGELVERIDSIEERLGELSKNIDTIVGALKEFDKRLSVLEKRLGVLDLKKGGALDELLARLGGKK